MSRSKPQKGPPSTSVEPSEFLVSGQVRRVGYRRLVLRAARKNGVIGYVENLRDETVKVVAQGPRAKLKSFISDTTVMEEPILVEGVSERRLGGRGRYSGFTIRPGLSTSSRRGSAPGRERLALLTDEFRDHRGNSRTAGRSSVATARSPEASLIGRGDIRQTLRDNGGDDGAGEEDERAPRVFQGRVPRVGG